MQLLLPTLRAGCEPAREHPILFRVQRVNHSAIAAFLLSLALVN